MVPGQNKSNADDDTQDKTDHETKPGGVPDGTLAQVKNPRRLIFVHALNLHLCLPGTTGVRVLCFSVGRVP